ncbi:hypothetical protein HXQ74_004207 [Salmonella enterica]|nr:hypothetical protein [Salmonella enterica]ECZ8208150.1 hypothetical protein [Salmonella enterica]EFI4888568.1 hypothetical protein [Salmonella enterica]EFS4764831.1 hypothetical protein [Salmonella enterica]EIQ0766783.1 hypothetical protein [Salmonella enterica]
MKIITCYKCVPDEQDIAINNADGTLDFSKADSKISQYDLNAIEAACQLKQQLGDAQVVAMSVGGKALTNAKGRKDVLSTNAYLMSRILRLIMLTEHSISAKRIAKSANMI